MSTRRIVVKKPFSLQHEEKASRKKARKDLDLEFEEKPVVASTLTSEETHGGEEYTLSIESKQFKDFYENYSQPSEQGESREEGELSSSASSSDSTAVGSTETVAEAGKPGGKPGERESEEAESGSEESGSEASGEESYEGMGEEASTGEEEGEAEGLEEHGKHEGESDEYEGEEYESEYESEDSTAVEEVDSVKENIRQVDSVKENIRQVVDVTRGALRRYYQTEFYRFIEMIAEAKTRVFDPSLDDEYNVKKLLFRQYEKKPLKHYKQARVRDAVVLILDNSGSMSWWTESLRLLADLALKRKDVEIYIAPNGYIRNMISPKGLVVVDHDAVVKRLKGRKIIYVGDYDGANTPIELSWHNDVIWVCPESRYRRFLSHDWVKYSEDKFHGAFIRAYSLSEMFDAFKKILARPYIYRVWLDYHKNEAFEDD